MCYLENKVKKKIRITRGFIDGQIPGPKDKYFWDDKVRGLQLKLTPTGRTVWVLQYRTLEKRQRKFTIGYYPEILPEDARRRATAALAEISSGKDPMAERKAARDRVMFSAFAERYLEEHAQKKKKERSRDEDQRLLDKFILPALGRKILAEIGRADVQKLHSRLHRTAVQANRVLALLSKMFSLAEQWELRPDHSNPCMHVQRYKEHGRERFLSEQEYRRLFAVLAEVEEERTASAAAILAIKLLLLTGRRKGEVLTLRWSDIDLAAGTMSLPDTKTGRKYFPLAPAAVQLLCRAKANADDTPWVIPGRRQGRPMSNIQRPWARIRKRAGLDDVRLHDLRHSYASVAAMAGQSLPQIGAQLGHSQPQTTKRYAHFADRSLAAAASEVGAQIFSFSELKEGDHAGA